jgi:histidyl-tRNA synthetase
MTKIEPRLLKGFRDYGAKEQATRQRMFERIQAVFERFGFLPLSTPALEYKDILMGKYGEDEKLIYSFKDNGERDVAMRYDLTVPLARYVAQNKNQLVFPFKRYQIAPVWRADNPQRGRLREFYQCDIDTVGTDSKFADAEVIACVCKALEALGVSQYEVRINDRRIFNGMINMLGIGEDQTVEVIRAIDKLDKIGEDGVIRILEEKALSSKAIKKIKQYLSFQRGENTLGIPKQMEEDFADITADLQLIGEAVLNQGVSSDKIRFDFSIARGLDYYTSTVFEFSLTNISGFPSISAGGRYDSLLDQFSDQSLPAVGCSIGIDRLLDALQELGLSQNESLVKALVVNQDPDLQTEYVGIVSSLRNAGISCELYYEPVKLDKQFKFAESKNIPYAIILGKEERQTGVVKLKNLITREQEEVAIARLAEKLK